MARKTNQKGENDMTAKAGTTPPTLTASALKEALWETLQGIKSGATLPATGDAIACQAREILRTVKVQVQVANQAKRELSIEVLNFAER